MTLRIGRRPPLPAPALAGGALACLAAYEAVQLCKDMGLWARIQVYTFGCPRLGNHCERAAGGRSAAAARNGCCFCCHPAQPLAS